MRDTIIKDFITLKDDVEECTAILGNVQWFNDEQHDKKYEKVLLRDIKDSTGFILSKKEWFTKRAFITLAKKYINKEIRFTANVKQIALKGKKGPELYCEFSKITNIELNRE